MTDKLRVLDLFSGIGGFSLGLERTGGFETVAFCEIEEFPRKVLRKHWPEVPIFEDVRKLKGNDIGAVDVICGGYPCQPFSTAGRRKGAEDDRHLWPEFSRLVAELRPSWVIGENVAGHISMGLDDVLSDLEGQGYACRTFVIPACAVDAKHRRDRCWTLAHSQSERRREAGSDRQRPSKRTSSTGSLGNARSTRLGAERPRELRVAGDVLLSERWEQGADAPSGSSPHVAGTECRRRPGQRLHSQSGDTAESGRGEATEPFNGCFRAVWRPEPDVGRVAHGVPRRMDRLRALGNAVVPQIPELIGHAILEAQTDELVVRAAE